MTTATTYNYQPLNKIELTFLADAFGALVKGNDKAAMIAALEEKQLTPDEVKDALRLRRERITSSHPNHQEPVILRDDDVQLIRMRRANPSYEYRRHVFTQEHPYVLMSVKDASDLLNLETGFVIASAEEAKAFYGRD